MHIFKVIISKDMNGNACTLNYSINILTIWLNTTWNITNFMDSFRNNISKISIILKSSIDADEKILSNLCSMIYQVTEHVIKNIAVYYFSCLYLPNLFDEIFCDKLYFKG